MDINKDIICPHCIGEESWKVIWGQIEKGIKEYKRTPKICSGCGTNLIEIINLERKKDEN